MEIRSSTEYFEKHLEEIKSSIQINSLQILRLKTSETKYNFFTIITVMTIIMTIIIIIIIIISMSQTLIQDPRRTVVPKDLRWWFGPSRPVVKQSFHFFNARLCQVLLILKILMFSCFGVVDTDPNYTFYAKYLKKIT